MFTISDIRPDHASWFRTISRMGCDLGKCLHSPPSIAQPLHGCESIPRAPTGP